jgi:hypothetical protein
MKGALNLLARLLAAVVLSWPILMLEFWITVVTRWSWLAYIFITPGFAIRDALVRLRLMAPQTSTGHMPDFGPAIAFDFALNLAVVLVLLYVFPGFLNSFFPKREKA